MPLLSLEAGDRKEPQRQAGYHDEQRPLEGARHARS
jgi:hypothetical protein